ncbi:MAG: DUF1287 domain-containing protein [Armatimonadetes bacterium]|nr:DUF1287 domain-containing protein [Armatimonadota bacterium]
MLSQAATLVILVLQSSPAEKIVAGAKAQLSAPAFYTQRYYSIPYPNGDVPKNRGACTDVVIRALRAAGKDLQKLIHEDMKRGIRYPRQGSRPDPNIDHRRVPNQAFFFKRFGKTLPCGLDSPTWKPGDFVYWKLGGKVDHIGVLVDHVGPSGHYMVVHNLSKTMMEDVLGEWDIVGHFRYPK